MVTTHGSMKKKNGGTYTATKRRRQRYMKRKGLACLFFLLLLLCLIPYIALLQFSATATGTYNNSPGSTTASTTASSNAMVYLLRKVGLDVSQYTKWRNKIYTLQRTQALAFDSRYLPPYTTDWLPFGHVMRELAQRILSRHIASSHVLILGDHAAGSHNSVVSNLTQFSRQQDHVTHVLSTSFKNKEEGEGVLENVHVEREYLDTWWARERLMDEESSSSSRASNKKERPNWLLLTVLDDPQVFSSPEGAVQFFEDSPPTMTYIVASITATMTMHGKTHNYTFTGMDTIRLLLKQHYKVQLLSATDFWSNGLAYKMTNDDTVFLPNALITNDNLQAFFEWGAHAAATSRALVADNSNEVVLSYLQKRDEKISAMEHANTAPPPVFKAYLFCTQGLDLAIPSRREYLQEYKFASQGSWPYPYRNAVQERRTMVQRVNFTKCNHRENAIPDGKMALYHQDRHDRLKLTFREEFVKRNNHAKANPGDATLFLHHAGATVYCDGQDVTRAVIERSGELNIRIWMNDKDDPSKAESICIQLDCNNFVYETFAILKRTDEVSCATRILPKFAESEDIRGGEQIKKKDNLLVVLLDPISRTQFDFMFPKTMSQILVNETTNLGFVNFKKYTTVGNNSGPNQAALYAGQKLLRHDGIRPSGSGARDKWIWDQLNEAGYATFKAEDGCIANSNMVQSMKPNTTHGQALHELFCFHFGRPNCVGGQLAADYLLDHAQQFIDVYSTAKRPWAAFLSLVDTHEDTMTLGAIIDSPLHRFLSWATDSSERLEDTTIVVLSDHGLHYGPYFQSTDGERERSEPILFVRPSSRQSNDVKNSLLVNSDKYVTPFDMHETLLDLVGIPPVSKMPIGSTLVKALPESRSECSGINGIPTRHCELVDSSINAAMYEKLRRIMPQPPALSSFFADIPRDHRWKEEPCSPITQNIRAAFKNPSTADGMCRCATSHRKWFDCQIHPWDTDRHEEEYFVLIQCPNFDLHYETRVMRDKKLVEKRKLVASATVRTGKKDRPNILVIEVDSVSVEYADRHLPRTRELLRRHRISTNGGDRCLGGTCAVDFSNFGIVGPNSVSNQVASLSGCLATVRHLSCFKKKIEIGDVCQDSTVQEYGMKVQSLGPTLHNVYCPVNSTQPFIYDIARKQGYLTFFGEEFCYTGSPWVVQDNVFPLNADFASHNVFCKLAENMFPETSSAKMFKKKLHGSCVDTDRGIRLHDIGLEVIRQMWSAYDGVPKFAYLNAMAAHTYTSKSAKAALASEEYDEKLSSFLESFLSRADAKETIIIMRSDHGLQGGDSATLDYSTQIESIHPWTEILVPDTYPVDNLIANSASLVTPFDLYTMMRDLIVGEKDSNRPDWMYNILQETVPDGHSCEPRKVPSEFCPTGPTPFPSFGVCNMFEGKQAIFCRDPSNGAGLYNSRSEYEIDIGKKSLPNFNEIVSGRKGGATSDKKPVKVRSRLQSSYAKHFSVATDKFIKSTTKMNQLPSRNATDAPCGVDRTESSAKSFEKTRLVWFLLDGIVTKYRGKSKVSGGIFLYPRQSMILTSILQLLELKIEGKIRVCETGFGAGHSTALFLAASPRVEVITFDKFDRPYQLQAANFLKEQFGRTRLRHMSGDTCKTVPAFFSNKNEPRCDFIHGSSFCPSDMMDLMKVLKPNGVVTATAMNGLLDKDVYFGPKAQWRQLRQEGCISDTTCWKEEHRKLEKSFVFAKEGTEMEHKFCIALNTGKCSPESSSVLVDAIDLDFEGLCSASSRVPVPA